MGPLIKWAQVWWKRANNQSRSVAVFALVVAVVAGLHMVTARGYTVRAWSDHHGGFELSPPPSEVAR